MCGCRARTSTMSRTSTGAGTAGRGRRRPRAILDGELVVLDDEGRPRFELIQRHERQARCPVRRAVGRRHDVIGLPFEDRRRCSANWSIQVRTGRAGPRVGGGADSGCHGRARAGGVMAAAGTTYHPGTGQGMAQGQAPAAAEVVIGGTHKGRATARRDSRAARRAVVHDRWRSPAASGRASRSASSTRCWLGAELRIDDCPFDPPPPTAYRRGATWVEPVLRATVEITEFTNEGYVRQASSSS